MQPLIAAAARALSLLMLLGGGAAALTLPLDMLDTSPAATGVSG